MRVKAWFCAILLYATTAGGQDTRAPVTQPVIVGPAAGIALSHVSLSLRRAPAQSERLLAGHIGLELAPLAWPCRGSSTALCRELAGVRLTPHVTLAATHLRGLGADSEDYAFSYFQVAGGKLAYQLLARLRPFVLLRQGTVTMERNEVLSYGRDVVNYVGTGTILGVGFEIPLVPSGRGLELAITRIRGRFEERELWDQAAPAKVFVATDVPFRAVTFHLGWSGPFTGASWPWQ